MIRKWGVLFNGGLTTILLSLCAAGLAGAGGAVHAQEAPPHDINDYALMDTWKGEWTSPDGFLYHAESHWTVKPDGSLEGYILWTLKRSPRDNQQQKIGMTGREYVRGRFNSSCSILSMEGYRKEDPNGILGLDKYRLILTENREVMAGPTWNHGNWKGLLSLTR